jgi:hypothetical protein
MHVCGVQLTTLWSVPLFSWLLVATAIWPALILSSLAVNLFVLLIETSLIMFENIHYMLMGLSRALRCASALVQADAATQHECRCFAPGSHLVMTVGLQVPCACEPRPCAGVHLNTLCIHLAAAHVALCAKTAHQHCKCCRLLVAALIFRLVSLYLVDVSAPQKPEGALRLLSRATFCAVIFAVIELVKTLSCRMLALRVHSSSLFDTLQART